MPESRVVRGVAVSMLRQNEPWTRKRHDRTTETDLTSSDGRARLEVAMEHETVWLSQAQMGQLFDTTPENVLMHLQNIFKDEELVEQATTKEFLVVRQEGKRQVRRRIKHYNLDGIISVGYRVSSKAMTSCSWQRQASNNPTCSH